VFAFSFCSGALCLLEDKRPPNRVSRNETGTWALVRCQFMRPGTCTATRRFPGCRIVNCIPVNTPEWEVLPRPTILAPVNSNLHAPRRGRTLSTATSRASRANDAGRCRTFPQPPYRLARTKQPATIEDHNPRSGRHSLEVNRMMVPDRLGPSSSVPGRSVRPTIAWPPSS
jgi:hypothetical protein